MEDGVGVDVRMVYIELASPTKNQFQLTALIHTYIGSSIGRKTDQI